MLVDVKGTDAIILKPNPNGTGMVMRWNTATEEYSAFLTQDGYE